MELNGRSHIITLSWQTKIINSTFKFRCLLAFRRQKCFAWYSGVTVEKGVILRNSHIQLFHISCFSFHWQTENNKSTLIYALHELSRGFITLLIEIRLQEFWLDPSKLAHNSRHRLCLYLWASFWQIAPLTSDFVEWLSDNSIAYTAVNSTRFFSSTATIPNIQTKQNKKKRLM